MKMVEVKTAELSGPALDWAVAHATKAWEWAHEWFPTMTLDPTFLGVSDNAPGGSVRLVPRNPMRQDPQRFTPSTDWSQGGPLIEKHIGELVRDQEEYSEPGEPWYADCSVFWQIGQTPLIAACRAIVAANSGDAVSVPAELMGPPK